MDCVGKRVYLVRWMAIGGNYVKRMSSMGAMLAILLICSLTACKVPKPPDAPKVQYDENLCAENEEVLFYFKVTQSAKALAICTSTNQPDYIVYRYGTREKIELEFPASKVESWQQFTYSYYLRGGGPGNEGLDLNYLRFGNGGYKYEVYQVYSAADDAMQVGVRITDKATNKRTEIKGVSESMKGSLAVLRENTKIRIE